MAFPSFFQKLFEDSGSSGLLVREILPKATNTELGVVKLADILPNIVVNGDSRNCYANIQGGGWRLVWFHKTVDIGAENSDSPWNFIFPLPFLSEPILLTDCLGPHSGSTIGRGEWLSTTGCGGCVRCLDTNNFSVEICGIALGRC